MSLPDLPKTRHLVIELDEDITLNMAKLLRIDAGNLVDEYEKHAGWQGLIASYHAEAKIRVMRSEDEYDAKEAEAYFHLVENFETIYGAKPTVDRLKMALVSNPDLQALRNGIIELKAQELRLESARNSFMARKDMLISLGAHERSERKL